MDFPKSLPIANSEHLGLLVKLMEVLKGLDNFNKA